VYESVILDAVVGEIEGGEGRVGLEQDSNVMCSITRERIAAEREKIRKRRNILNAKTVSLEALVPKLGTNTLGVNILIISGVNKLSIQSW